MFELPFSLLTLQHFGPTWEGMFWLQGLKKDIFKNGALPKQSNILHIFLILDHQCCKNGSKEWGVKFNAALYIRYLQRL